MATCMAMAFPRSSPSDRGQCMACASRRPGPLSMRWWPCASPFHRANGSPAMVDSGVAEAEADAIESERACVCVPRESRRVRCLGGPTRHLAVVVADRSLDTLEMSLECVRREAVRMRRMLTDPVTTHSSGALHLPLCGLQISESHSRLPGSHRAREIRFVRVHFAATPTEIRRHCRL